jgi:hypothetical protein
VSEDERYTDANLLRHAASTPPSSDPEPDPNRSVTDLPDLDTYHPTT